MSIRILYLGAHPDDGEVYGGGTAALWAQAGYAVKIISLTDGRAGHHRLSGDALVDRRRQECVVAAQQLGVAYEILDNPDGALEPTLYNRNLIIKIDTVYDQKLAALHAHTSQFYEWLPWIEDHADQVPDTEAARLDWLRQRWPFGVDERSRTSLVKWYGAKNAAAVRHAEAFELCEYGRQPDEEEVRGLFPMVG